jgi:N-acetylneuraminic acid mutarotase
MTNLQGGPATLLQNGQVLFAGGYNNGASLATSELYNPTTGMFSLTGSMTEPRNAAGAALLTNGQVLVVGGSDNNGPLASAELYTPPN